MVLEILTARDALSAVRAQISAPGTVQLRLVRVEPIFSHETFATFGALEPLLAQVEARVRVQARLARVILIAYVAEVRGRRGVL